MDACYGFLRNQRLDRAIRVAPVKDPLTQAHMEPVSWPIARNRTFVFANFEQTAASQRRGDFDKTRERRHVNNRLDSISFIGREFPLA